MEYNPILSAFIFIYIIYSIFISMKIWKAEYLNKTQRIFNIIFTWIIPFLWGIIIKGIITPSNTETMTKNKRKSKSGKSSDNWQSLTGGGSGDIG